MREHKPSKGGSVGTTNVAKILRDWRTGAGLTREQVARAAGVSTMAYYWWETGRNQPTLDSLYRLTAAGFNPMVLFQTKGDQ